MIGGKTTFYDENMSIVFFILISRDVYQKLLVLSLLLLSRKTW